MAHIKKLVMKGFKSFPKETEIPFVNSMNVVVGPNGSGKCVTGDTKIYLSDGRAERIDKVVNKRLGKAKKTEDGFIIEGDGTKIECLDFNTLKTSKKPIKKFVKRKSPKKILKIKTRSGKEIKVTKYHPLFTLKDGEIKALKSEELEKGTRVAVPRKVGFEPENKNFCELIEKIKQDDKIYIPYREEFRNILKQLKKERTWKKLASEIGISHYTIKGLLDKQSINLASLIKILKFASLSNKEIIGLLDTIIRNGKKTKFSFKNSPDFSRFFGYLLSDGRLASSSQIWFTNGTREVVDDYVYLVKKLFRKKPLVREYKTGCWDVIFYSEPLRKILKKLGMGSDTRKKRISNAILKHSSDREVSNLLNGLFCGDGYISNKSIEITTKSEELARGIETCFLRLGITFTTRDVKKGIAKSGFSAEYKTIVVYGVNNFLRFNEKIRLVHNKKNNKIKKLIMKKANTNVDLIEANQLIKKTAKEFSINVKKIKKQFPILDAYCYNQCLPSRDGLKLLCEKVFNGHSESKEKLNTLANSDIFWDEIIKIEEIPGEKWVYDLCVELHHNFIANNIFVHNSNIVDALCFVLGRMSIKSMRAERASNLIFAGAKGRKPEKEASVNLVFSNKDKTFSVDSKEVSIQRIVRKNGQSTYKINKETKTRQEIIDLLAQAGIDPYGFNIVLQGEIQEIVKMKPEERREIIEEVAGISIYEDRKKKSLNELEKTDEKFKQVSATLRERRSYLKNLEKERRQALKFKKFKKRVKRYKASILKRKISRKKKNLSNFIQELEEKEDKKQEKRNQEKKARQEIKQFEKRINKIDKDIEGKTGVRQENLQSQISNLRADLVGIEVREENNQSRLEEIKERREKRKKEEEKLEKEIKRLRKEKPQTGKQEELNEKKKQLEQAEAKKKKSYNLKEKLKSIKDKKQDRENLLNEKQNESSFLFNQVDNLSDKLKYKEIEKAEKQVKELEKKEKETRNTVENKQELIRGQENNSSIYKSEIARLQEVKEKVENLDICPLCKSRITSKHIEQVKTDCDEKISNYKEKLEKLDSEKTKEEISNLKEKMKKIQQEREKAEKDLVNLKWVEEKKEAIKKIENEKKEIEKQIQDLSKKQKEIKNKLSKLKNIEEDYDKIFLEIQEISSRTKETVNAEQESKERDLEKLKIEQKQSFREQEDLEEELEELEDEEQEKREQLEEKEEKQSELEEIFKNLNEEKNSLQKQIHEKNSFILEIQNNISRIEEKENDLKIEKARIDAELENLETDFKPYENVKVINQPVHTLESKLEKTQNRIEKMGAVNLKSLEVYSRVKKEYDKVEEKAEKLMKEKEEILKVIEKIDKKKKKVFMKTLKAVNELFNRNFRQLSKKGEAFLRPENKNEIFEAGLDIEIKIGRGKYFDISSLSGGEKTLVALSLLFAIQEYKPYCFYIFDEVDAALDKRNSERLAALIKKHMKTGQYIIITHNDALITESSVLYGVSMQKGVSKIVTLEV